MSQTSRAQGGMHLHGPAHQTGLPGAISFARLSKLSKPPSHEQGSWGTSLSLVLPGLVDKPIKCLHRSSLCSASADAHFSYECIRSRLGSRLKGFGCLRTSLSKNSKPCLACVAFLPHIRGKSLLVLTDNTRAMFYVNRQRGHFVYIKETVW